MDFTRSGKFSRTSSTTNVATGEVLSTYGFYGSALIYSATSSDKTLTGSAENEAFIYDLTLSGTNALRFSGFTAFDAGAGDDILDFTVRAANAGSEYATSANLYGGLGNDVIWTAGSKLNWVYGDSGTLAGTSASAILLGGNDTIDASAASAACTVYGDSYTVSWAKGGDDSITGSALADSLYGDGNELGNNTTPGTKGTGGNDIIYGKAGADKIYGDANLLGLATNSTTIGGNDILYAYDAVTAGTEADTLYGEGSTMGAANGTTAIGGNDTLYGSDGVNVMYGDADKMGSGGSSVVTGGNDTLFGRGGNDYLIGEGTTVATEALAKVTCGADILYGEDGNDNLYGDVSGVGNLTSSTNSQTIGGADRLFGGAGDDVLYGDAVDARSGVTLTCGNDRLDGGTGTDKLYGDISGSIGSGATVKGGNDTFVFQPGSGTDTIYDFGQVADSRTGDDLIDVSAYGYTSFAGLTLSGNGTATVTVDFGSGNSVAVKKKDNTALTLDASDFVFAA